jgi:hypothetical protein
MMMRDELLKLCDAKEKELNILRRKSLSKLWREDLDNFSEVLRAVEKTEETQNNRTTVETNWGKEVSFGSST